MASTAVASVDHGAGEASSGSLWRSISNARSAVAGSIGSAVAKTGALARAGAYRGSYGASYGVVFGAVFVKELLPNGNALRRGFEDGSEAAFDAVEARKAPKAGSPRGTA